MIFILLPAYNEEKSIPSLLLAIDVAMKNANETYRMVVCDDGSDDDTWRTLAEASNKYPLETIKHTINRGLGETIRDLFEYASSNAAPGDIIVRMDCDLTHDPETIQSLAKAIREGADVALASRFQDGGGQVGVEGSRKWLSFGAHIFMRFFFPIKGVREYSCGFRAYRASILQKALLIFGNDFIQLQQLGFSCTLEKLVKLHLIGATFSEVPFILRYDRKVSESKMIANLTTLGYLLLVVLYHWPFGGWRRHFKRNPVHD